LEPKCPYCVASVKRENLKRHHERLEEEHGQIPWAIKVVT